MAFIGWRDYDRTFREMERLSRVMDEWAAQARPLLPAWVPLAEFPPVNVYETADAIIVEAELPGVKAESVDLSVTADMVSLAGERVPETGQGANYHRHERRTGRFVRSINLPERIRTDKVEAKYADGILTVRLPKTEEAKVHKVHIAGEKREEVSP